MGRVLGRNRKAEITGARNRERMGKPATLCRRPECMVPKHRLTRNTHIVHVYLGCVL